MEREGEEGQDVFAWRVASLELKTVQSSLRTAPNNICHLSQAPR